MIESLLQQQYYDIECRTTELLNALTELNCIQSRVFVLPRVGADDTYAPITEITPKMVDEFIGEVKAKHVLSDYYGDANFSTKCPIKMPGLIQYQGNDVAIGSLVVALNNAKDLFKRSVVAIGNEDEQFRIVHSLFPYLISDQLTRHVHIASSGLKSVGFSFVNKQLSDTITPDTAIRLIEKNYFTPQNLMSPCEWQDLNDKAVARINALPENYKIVRRRDGKVQPVCNLRYGFGYKQKAASLPLIYVNNAPEKVKINDLSPYVSENKMKNRRPSRANKSILIDKWLKIYATPIIKKNVASPLDQV